MFFQPTFSSEQIKLLPSNKLEARRLHKQNQHFSSLIDIECKIFTISRANYPVKCPRHTQDAAFFPFSFDWIGEKPAKLWINNEKIVRSVSGYQFALMEKYNKIKSSRQEAKKCFPLRLFLSPIAFWGNVSFSCESYRHKIPRWDSLNFHNVLLSMLVYVIFTIRTRVTVMRWLFFCSHFFRLNKSHVWVL